jgi:hypothetical protein
MNLVVNCFHFTLKSTCYLSDGRRIEVDTLNAEEIIKVFEGSGATSMTLMGPKAITEKIAKEIKEIKDLEIHIMGATYD